jgi:hypothetical protein
MLDRGTSRVSVNTTLALLMKSPPGTRTKPSQVTSGKSRRHARTGVIEK